MKLNDALQEGHGTSSSSLWGIPTEFKPPVKEPEKPKARTTGRSTGGVSGGGVDRGDANDDSDGPNDAPTTFKVGKIVARVVPAGYTADIRKAPTWKDFKHYFKGAKNFNSKGELRK